MSRSAWTFAIVSVALFMFVLDNLVVTTALPSIRTDLGGSLEDLQWTVNAYTLSFAVLLMTGAALGDRFGRRRMFVIGLGVFTGASALCALSPNVDVLIAVRALQGIGGGIAVALITDVTPPDMRGKALGIWGAITGVAVAAGPLVGGAIVDGLAWQWIF